MFGFQRPERSAAVYRLDTATLVHSMDKATSGVWLAGEFAILLSEVASAEEIGAAVEQALLASRQDVPHPTDWKCVGREVLAVAGKNSWRALEKGAVLTHVMKRGSSVRLIPTRNGGAIGDDRGFHELTDREQTLPVRSSPSELGRAITRALTESE